MSIKINWSFLGIFKQTFSKTKKSLFTFNNEPFSKFSILLIIMLDIFLLVTILNGISSEKNMAPDIYQKYPPSCTKHFNPIFKSETWDNNSNRYIFRIHKSPFKEYSAFEPFNNYGYYSSKHIRVKDDLRISKFCRDLDSKISVFSKTREFKNNKKLLLKLKKDKRKTFSDINHIEQRYNTALFEKNVNEHNGELYTNKKKYYSLLDTEKTINKQIESIKKVESYKGYSDYVDFIKNNKSNFKKEHKGYIFWQPFISFLYLLKFTIPLLLLFLFAYKVSNRIQQDKTVPMKLLKLISSHIILISIVPIFINILYLIYHIIPHRFLESIIGILYKFGVMFLGYYFIIFIGIIFFGLLIFFIQRNRSKREAIRRDLKEKTLYIDAYNKSICPACKNNVDYKRNYCGYCKEKLNRVCSSCGVNTPKNIKYCLDCSSQ